MKFYWNQFWYFEMNPKFVGYTRMWFFTCSFFVSAFVDTRWPHFYGDWARWPYALYDRIPILELLNIYAPSKNIAFYLSLIYFAFLLLAAVGLFTRTSIFLSLILGLYLNSLKGLVVMPSHNMVLPLLAHGLFLFSKDVYQCSLDSRVFQNLRERRTRISADSWIFKLVLVLWALMFFSAGVSKLRVSGWEWISEYPMYFYVSYWILADSVWAGQTLRNLPPLILQGLSFFAVMTELLAPLALFSRVQLIMIGVLYGLLVGIIIFMGPPFYSQLCLLLLLIGSRVGRIKKVEK